MGWRRQLLRLAALLGLAYVGVGVMFVALQSRLAFHPRDRHEGSPTEFGLDYQDVHLHCADGKTIHGWFVPHENPRATMLFFHGNAGNISHRTESLNLYHQLGLAVLIVDYHGYGRSEGKPRERNTYLDADAAWAYLTETRSIPPEQIVIFGRSLGGAVATYLAEKHTPGALIVESTFTSAADMARTMLPIYPRFLVRIGYDTQSRIAGVRCPVLVVHSRDDELVPFAQGQAVFDAAPQPKEFLELEGGHNEGFLLCVDRYMDALDGFIGMHLGGQTLR